MQQTASHTYPLMSQHALTDPYPLLHRMRRDDPVHWSEELQAWILTRYDDALQALKDQRLSNRRFERYVRFQLRHSDPALAKDFDRIGRGMMVDKDGREHLRLRRLANHGFTTAALDSFRPMIQQVTDELLDRVRAEGRMDVVADLAQPLPALAIAEMFAIPPADRVIFQKWSDDVSRFFGGTLGDVETDAQAANEGAAALEGYFMGLLKERQRRPGSDLMSLLLCGRAEGKLSLQEVCSQSILLLVAGHVTTTDQLSNAVCAFLDHPDQRRLLRAEPALIHSAVEEVMRYDGAVQFVLRIAAQDLEIAGKRISQGQQVYVGLGAANRDPAVFAEPDRLDITRLNHRHLAFGAGPHLCLGAGLARRELEIALGTLLRRLPGLRHDELKPARRKCQSLIFRGFFTLPVRFEAGG
jgi:cytochrome P450 PksS